jgi:hypothetical protein
VASAVAPSDERRKSPYSWRERSVAVPTSTRRSPPVLGSAPLPRSRSTSHPISRAGPRRATGAHDHVRSDPVDRGDPDEPARNGALPEEDARRGTFEPDACERLVDGALEAGETLGPIARDPEPHGAYRPGGRRDVLDRARRRAVGGDRDAGKDTGQHRCSDDEPEGRDQGATVASAQSAPGETADEPGGPHGPDLLRRRYSAVFVRFPQIDIEHHVDDAFREAS